MPADALLITDTWIKANALLRLLTVAVVLCLWALSLAVVLVDG